MPGKSVRFWFCLPAIILLLLCCATAQVPAPANGSVHGWFGNLTFNEVHDSQVGYSTLLGAGVGYDLNRKLSVSTGIPFYLISAISQTKKTTGETVVKQHEAQIGDYWLRLDAQPYSGFVTWKANVAGTAPTGNTKYGLSSGRATWTNAHHLEKDVAFLTPFVEATVGNTVPNNKRYLRNYTTLGYVSMQTGGVDFDLTHGFSFESAAYEVTPFGDQKVYSRVGKNGKLKQVTEGTASLTKDHGFSGGLSFTAGHRISCDLDYTRSITDHIDAVTLSFNYRFGHVMPEKKKQ